MADVKDPVAELFRCVDWQDNLDVEQALRELERRARVERRLEAWLGQGAKVVGHTFDGMGNVHTVRVTARPVEVEFIGRIPRGVYEGAGFDSWTAYAAALDKAGAPKESE